MIVLENHGYYKDQTQGEENKLWTSFLEEIIIIFVSKMHRHFIILNYYFVHTPGIS